MIDPATETLVPIQQAPAAFPGHRPHLASLYRWAFRKRNPLETVCIGARRFTSREAILRFIAACTDPTTKPVAPSSRRKREIEAAEAACQAAGC